ncbi:hypothetical protein Dda_2792 [Drechslerella dactyloides]|uniref:Uncharacterized protein n=1 Tax=Drechslerella dactyloides TaxID=74499 RepID=A0AAD6J4I7_DREDA|nr:hypothetical protein Dda_2792 [Drechslerella dactyloides]
MEPIKEASVQVAYGMHGGPTVDGLDELATEACVYSKCEGEMLQQRERQVSPVVFTCELESNWGPI